MLDFAKVESGKLAFRPQPMELSAALNDVLGMVAGACVSRSKTMA